MLEVYLIGFSICLLGSHAYVGYQGKEMDFFYNVGYCFAWPLVLSTIAAEAIGMLVRKVTK